MGTVLGVDDQRRRSQEIIYQTGSGPKEGACAWSSGIPGQQYLYTRQGFGLVVDGVELGDKEDDRFPAVPTADIL